MADLVNLGDMLPAMRETLDAGGEVSFISKGRSMLPMLRDGVDTVILKKPKFPLKRYDIPLYIRKNDKFVLHRIIAIKDGQYIIRGDNCTYIETDIADENIVAVLCGFVRNGKKYSVDNFFYKIYSRVYSSELFYFFHKRAIPKLKRIVKKVKKKIINRH